MKWRCRRARPMFQTFSVKSVKNRELPQQFQPMLALLVVDGFPWTLTIITTMPTVSLVRSDSAVSSHARSAARWNFSTRPTTWPEARSYSIATSAAWRRSWRARCPRGRNAAGAANSTTATTAAGSRSVTARAVSAMGNAITASSINSIRALSWKSRNHRPWNPKTIWSNARPIDCPSHWRPSRPNFRKKPASSWSI